MTGTNHKQMQDRDGDLIKKTLSTGFSVLPGLTPLLSKARKYGEKLQENKVR